MPLILLFVGNYYDGGLDDDDGTGRFMQVWSLSDKWRHPTCHLCHDHKWRIKKARGQWMLQQRQTTVIKHPYEGDDYGGGD